MASKAWCAHPAENGQKPLPRFCRLLVGAAAPNPAGRSALLRPFKPLPRLLRPAAAGLSFVRVASFLYALGDALRFLFSDTEDAFAVVFRGLPLFMFVFEFVVVAV